MYYLLVFKLGRVVNFFSNFLESALMHILDTTNVLPFCTLPDQTL